MTRRPTEDLFEETRMTFGEHLDELRGALVRSLIGVAIGCVIGFMIGDQVIAFLQRPLMDAIRKYYDRYALQDFEQEQGFPPPEMQSRIQREGVVPERVLVDPGQLVDAIRSISPDALGQINLKPYQIAMTSLTPDGAAGIARALTERDNPDERVKAIAALLTKEQLGELERIAGLEAGQVSKEDIRPVVDALNAALEERSLHQASAFRAMLTQEEGGFLNWFFPVEQNTLAKMKLRVDEEPGNLDLSRRLNRMLIARTFAGHIRHPDMELVPMEIWRRVHDGTQALGAQEPFMVWMKASIVTGLVISAPWVFYQLWLFVAAGLYPHEQKYVYWYLPLSIGLFVFGVALAFTAVFDPVLQFLFSFNASMGIRPQLRIGEWLSFVLFLPLGFGIAFQLPVVMVFLQRIGLFTAKQYLAQWRIAIMTISVVSMVLTPADPISLFLMGIPLVGLYFLGIGLCKWMPRPENQNPFRERPA